MSAPPRERRPDNEVDKANCQPVYWDYDAVRCDNRDVVVAVFQQRRTLTLFAALPHTGCDENFKGAGAFSHRKLPRPFFVLIRVERYT